MIRPRATPLVLALAFGVLVASAMPDPKESSKKANSIQTNSFDISGDELNNNVNDNNILILPYEPIEPKPTDYKTSVTHGQGNRLKSSSYLSEHESSKVPNVANVMAEGYDAEKSGTPNADKLKDIALNGREVRLVGPNQRVVEMKDDMPTKVAVALENLQKEASEAWGQVYEKLEKTWADVKQAPIWGQVNEKLDKGLADLKKSDVVGQVNEKLAELKKSDVVIQVSDKIDKSLTDIKQSETLSQVNDQLGKGWESLKSMVEGVVSPSTAQKPAGN